MSDEEDPYAVSSDSEDEKPRKKIDLGAKVDLSSLKKAVTEQKEAEKDAEKQQELEALSVAKKEEMVKMKKDFEAGTVKKENEEGEEESEEKKAEREEREKLTQIGKEKYSKFKDKFENITDTLGENLEERLKTMAVERELELINKSDLKSAKERFEKGEESVTVEKEKIEVGRSEADKKRILSTFNRDMTADEAPKECAICSKTVYPVERIFCNKKLYHKDCFKCNKCAKKLTPTNYNSHEGIILCKVHFLALKQPEMAATMDPENTQEDEREEEDEDFAVSSKPKKLAGDVVRSGGTTTEQELAALRGLGGKKKEEWESGAADVDKVDKTAFDASEIGAGRVKANKDRFLTGGGNEEEEEEEEEGERDPNIVRGSKKTKKEDLDLAQIGDIKNKWKTGEVETAEQKEAEGKAELEALKAGGVKVKERFQERKEEDLSEVKKWDRSELDTSAAADARKSFIEGKAYETGKEKEKSELEELQFTKLDNFKSRFEAAGNLETREELERAAVDVSIDLGNLKAAFLKKDEDMSPEERAALKKKEIEAEFIRYKLARKAASQRATEAGEEPTMSTAGVGDVKAAFDSGDAFKGGAGDKGGLDVEIKMAGKAREKFKEIDAAGAAPVLPGQNKKAEPSKWDKKEVSTAEVINRRADDREETPEDEDAFDVKNLMNKFKNIGQDEGRKVDSGAKAELEALKTGAKDVKSRFEKGEEDDKEKEEERKRMMQEEFDTMRKEREEAKKKLEEEMAEEDLARDVTKEDIAVVAEHAHKMTAKWEKIQAKEAKKAEKGKMPEKKTTND